MSVTYECCVLSRNGPIPGPEESYQMRVCVCVCVIDRDQLSITAKK